MDTKTRGLANTLAATTDQDRASILADTKESEEPKEKSEDTQIKEKMEQNEKADIMTQAFGKVYDAVRAAEEVAKDKAKKNPKAQTEDLFAESMGELLDIIKEMAENKDVFKQLVKEANKLRIS